MILIVGLGNPGEKYQNTRHNLGFMVVEAIAKKFLSLKQTNWEEEKKFNSLILRVPPNILLVKPQTFMNSSGMAVKKMANFFKIEPENIWIIHDDIDLPLGKIKIRLGGGSGGHRGVESVIEQLGTDKFIRFRLGIGHPGRGKDSVVEKYVLQEFDVNQKSEIKKMIKKTVKAVEVGLKEGIEKAMNKFNS
ncbi:MAG: aminoacyl-tRNA hydrolase [Microgenomates group bacterium]